MKNIILVLSILLFSFDALSVDFSYGVGTKMWDAAVKGNRPVAMLSTLSGMATAPLLIPLFPIGQLLSDDDKTAGDVAFALTCGTGLGVVWMIAYELFGIFDLCTLGETSSDGVVQDIAGILGELLTKPAYVWYIDGIDNAIEDAKKSREKKDEESDEN